MKKKEMTLIQLVNKVERLNKNLESLHIEKRYCLYLNSRYSMHSHCIRNKQDMLDVLDLFALKIEYFLKNCKWKYDENNKCYEIASKAGNYYISIDGELEKMKLEEVKKTIEDLKEKGYDIFYTKGDDADSVKVYEDEKQVIYINYNYGYIDIISK